MSIVITGATGFIGRYLCQHFSQSGIEVIALTRNAEKGQKTLGNTAKCVQWDGKTTDNWAQYVDGATAIINLAGANVADRPWSTDYKRIIKASRNNAGKAVSAAIQQATKKPRLLLQASAIGIYGSRGDETIGDNGGIGDGFLAEVVSEWEKSVQEVAANNTTRVVVMRLGVILGRGEGVLKKMGLPFKLFAGGPPGSGEQWLSWMHVQDVLSAISFFMENDTSRGSYNLVSPNPVKMNAFCKTFGKALGRPSWLPVPTFALKLLLGEMGEETVLSSQRVLPENLQKAGFEFKYRNIEDALTDLLKD